MSHASDKNAGEGQYGPKWGIWEIPPLPPCTDLSRITANATRQEEAGPLPGFFIACAEEGGKKQGDPPTSLCPACAGPDAQDLPALWAAEAGRPPKALACAGGPGRKIARALVVLLPPALLALFLRPLMLKVPIIPSSWSSLHPAHPCQQQAERFPPRGNCGAYRPDREKTKYFIVLCIRWHYVEEGRGSSWGGKGGALKIS